MKPRAAGDRLLLTARREVRRLVLVLWALLVWSIDASGQAPDRVLRLGFIEPGAGVEPVRGYQGAGFWPRLEELGWKPGKNLIVEHRWANGDNARFPELIADVLSKQVDVLVVFTTPAALAARQATMTVPIVAATMGDPVGTGLVTDLAHPGGNLTGLSQGWDEGIAGKWLDLAQEVAPRATAVAAVGNPDNPLVRKALQDLASFAAQRKLKLRALEVRDSGAIDSAFAAAAREAQAVIVIPDAMTVQHRKRVVALANKHRLPAVYGLLDFADAGGLLAFGVDQVVLFRRAADYVDKILRGARPGDLPIEQATKYSLIVNLKAARELKLKVSEGLLLRADEVIR
jgi:putative ABC transport system substrate-binding protein